MNELFYNFLNQVEDVNKVKSMSVEEFAKLVKENKMIEEKDAKILIESFKKISETKPSEDDSTDADERKKKYRDKFRSNEIIRQVVTNGKQEQVKKEEREDDSIEK